MLGLGRRDALLLLALLALAAALRFYRLTQPADLVFDEIYYAQDACTYLGWGASVCEVASEASRMHPPLGKWLISVGIALFGYDPFGWRVSAAVSGVLTVGLVYLLGQRLLRSTFAAALAAGVVALDPLSIVLSRVGMLDTFTTCAGVACLLFAVLERDAVLAASGPRSRVLSPWRVGAGLSAGFAVATKWSGALVVVAVLGLLLLWDIAAARRRGESAAAGLRDAVPSLGLWLVAAPALIYVASYAGRLDGDLLALPWRAGSWIREFVDRQLFMLRFHAGLGGTHPYASPAWSWLLDKRPIVFFFNIDALGRYREVLAFTNPVLMLPGLAAGLAAGAMALRRRVVWGPEPVIGLAIAASYLTWLLLAAGRPFVFAYYVLPAIPFLALALAWAVTAAPVTAARGLATAVGAVAVATVLIWQPLVYAQPLDYDAWRTRIVFSDCTSAETTHGRLAPRPDGGAPPPGWCWV